MTSPSPDPTRTRSPTSEWLWLLVQTRSSQAPLAPRGNGPSRYHRITPMIVARPSLRPAVALFRSLADPTRLAIVQRLAEGEARVVDLTRDLALPQSTVSTHLACLRDCALLDARSEGRQMFYSLSRSELLQLLEVAEALLTATGERVALCPRYGEPR